MLVEIVVFIIAIFLAEGIYRYGLSKLKFLTNKSALYQKRFKNYTIGFMFVFFMLLAVVLEII